MEEKIVLRVEGLDCIGCELNVVCALEKIDVVRRVEASFPEKKAIVHFDGKLVDP